MGTITSLYLIILLIYEIWYAIIYVVISNSFVMTMNTILEWFNTCEVYDLIDIIMRESKYGLSHWFFLTMVLTRWFLQRIQKIEMLFFLHYNFFHRVFLKGIDKRYFLCNEYPYLVGHLDLLKSYDFTLVC